MIFLNCIICYIINSLVIDECNILIIFFFYWRTQWILFPISLMLVLQSSIWNCRCAKVSRKIIHFYQEFHIHEPRHDKTNKMSVRPAKTQISLGIRPVWSESSLSAWRNLGSLASHWAQAKTLIGLDGCLGWSESSLGAHTFCWVCGVVDHIYLRSRCFPVTYTHFFNFCPYVAATNVFVQHLISVTDSVQTERFYVYRIIMCTE